MIGRYRFLLRFSTLLTCMCFFLTLYSSCSKKDESIIKVGYNEQGVCFYGGTLAIRNGEFCLEKGQRIFFDDTFRKSGAQITIGNSIVISDGKDAYSGRKVVTLVEITGSGGIVPVTGWLQRIIGNLGYGLGYGHKPGK